MVPLLFLEVSMGDWGSKRCVEPTEADNRVHGDSNDLENYESSSLEIEIKASLLEKVNLKDIVEHLKKEDVISLVDIKETSTTHTFYYDKDWDYVYSKSSNNMLKRKTNSSIVYHNGIPILVRKEDIQHQSRISSFLQKLKPKHDLSLQRDRQFIYMQKDGFKFYLCCDTCHNTELTNKELYQIEIEYCTSIGYNDLEDIFERLVEILTIIDKKFPILIKPITKYDWIKKYAGVK